MSPMEPVRTPRPLELEAADFDALRQLLRQRTGIVLEAGKEYFVELRLASLAQQEGFASLGELIDCLHTEEVWGPLHRRALEALAVTETSFFRDMHAFEAFRSRVLPELLERRAAERTLRIWSAASSSGQEAYSIAMVFRDSFPQLAGWHAQLIASDFSSAALERCRRGRYSQVEINRGLPATCLLKHFRKDGDQWAVRDELRAMLEVRELNLAGPWPSLPPMDVVFLRNVLIYFDTETRRSVLRNLGRILRPDGVLFLGSGETTLTMDDSFELVPIGRTVCYRLRTGRATTA